MGENEKPGIDACVHFPFDGSGQNQEIEYCVDRLLAGTAGMQAYLQPFSRFDRC